MNYAISVVHVPTGDISIVWTTFESEAEAQQWVAPRISDDYVAIVYPVSPLVH